MIGQVGRENINGTRKKFQYKVKFAERTISLTASWAYFYCQLLLTQWERLTLVTSSHVHPQFLGSAYWTAAENNLGLPF